MAGGKLSEREVKPFAMTYLPDLEPWGDPQLLAVGWLEPSQPYETGPVPEALLGKLVELFVDPWHACGLCVGSKGPRSFESHGRSIRMGSTNLYVPGEGVVYVAPSLILHYIESHRYAPPTVFHSAVLACPGIGSPPYKRALRSNGSAVLGRLLGEDA